MMNETDMLMPIYEPGPFDVVCGRGDQNASRWGNMRFYEIIDEYKEKYMATPSRHAKSQIVASIFNAIAPGRFVKRHDSIEGAYTVLEDKEARKKISHAMRYRVKTKPAAFTIPGVDGLAPQPVPASSAFGGLDSVRSERNSGASTMTATHTEGASAAQARQRRLDAIRSQNALLPPFDAETISSQRDVHPEEEQKVAAGDRMGPRGESTTEQDDDSDVEEESSFNDPSQPSSNQVTSAESDEVGRSFMSEEELETMLDKFDRD